MNLRKHTISNPPVKWIEEYDRRKHANFIDYEGNSFLIYIVVQDETKSIAHLEILNIKRDLYPMWLVDSNTYTAVMHAHNFMEDRYALDQNNFSQKVNDFICEYQDAPVEQPGDPTFKIYISFGTHLNSLIYLTKKFS